MKNLYILVIGGIIAVSIVSFTLIFIVLGSSSMPEGWLALYLGFLTTSIGVLVNLGKTVNIERDIKTLNDGVETLNNGRMDAKIRAGVADVVHDGFIDGSYVEQRTLDRVERGDIIEAEGNDSVTTDETLDTV